MDQLTSMRVFALAAQVGTLSGAARVLDMSPAMATKHVDALEKRLGIKLLHRTTRKLVLTETGQAYLDTVQRILAELDEADAAATSQRTQVTGLLRLNAPYAFGLRHRCSDLRQSLRPLRRRRGDIGFGHGPVAHLAVDAENLPALALRDSNARSKQGVVFAQITAHHQDTLQRGQSGNRHAQPAHFVASWRKLGMAQARINMVSAQAAQQLRGHMQFFHRAVRRQQPADAGCAVFCTNVFQAAGDIFQRGLPFHL